LEQAARQYILELLCNPETMRHQADQEVHKVIAALRNLERKIGAWVYRLAEADSTRVAYQDQQAEGLR
jgi:hypothetical protein